MNQPQAARRLITIEGGEGVGKSTAISTLRSTLEAAGLEVVATREPGGTALGEQLRELIRNHDGPATMDPIAELLLILAARAQHVAEVIQPSLARGAVVICDRFTDSTFAYQGAGRGIPNAAIAAMDTACVGLTPGLTLLLDAPVPLGRERSAARGLPTDRIEAEPDTFFERVRQCFLDRARAEPHRFAIIDAAVPLSMMEDAVQAAGRRWLLAHRPG